METFYLPYESAIGRISLFPSFEASLGISHDVFMPIEERGKGLGTKAHEYRLGVAKYLGLNYVLCTVRETNTAQIKILKKFGWQPLYKMQTYCAKVILFIKDLKDVKEIPHPTFKPLLLKEKRNNQIEHQ